MLLGEAFVDGDATQNISSLALGFDLWNKCWISLRVRACATRCSEFEQSQHWPFDPFSFFVEGLIYPLVGLIDKVSPNPHKMAFVDLEVDRISGLIF